MIGFMFFVMTILVIGLGILGVAAGLRRINPPESSPAISPTRLDRLESALGSMEARLDDLQDQQRFLEKLLEARPDTPSLRAGERAEEDQTPASERSILFDTEPEEER